MSKEVGERAENLYIELTENHNGYLDNGRLCEKIVELQMKVERLEKKVEANELKLPVITGLEGLGEP